jgi:hypothetical protein
MVTTEHVFHSLRWHGARRFRSGACPLDILAHEGGIRR